MDPERVIIVGASSGIGAAIAGELARGGSAVALLARREDELRARCAEISGTVPAGAPEPFYLLHDVRGGGHDVRGGISEAFAEAVERLGGLDVLVYAAGALHNAGPDRFDPELDRAIFEVNTVGAAAWLDLAATHFQAQGSGALVAISSVAADRGRRGNPAYCASKAALDTFMESLRNRLRVKGIVVLTVKPGFVETAMTEGMKGMFWLISPEVVAARVVRALRRGESTIYVPARWRVLMWVIRHIPSVIFRRLDI